MNKVDEYIDAIYKNTDKSSKEIKILKCEMKSHILESISELMKEGKTEEESIEISLKRFGDAKEIGNDIINISNTYKKWFKLIIIMLLIITLIPLMVILFPLRDDIMFKNSILIFIIPTYGIIKYVALEKSKKYSDINKKKEFLKIIFEMYIIFIIGRFVFPIYLSKQPVNNLSFKVYAIPFTDILNKLMSSGTIVGTLLSCIKLITMYMPLGILAPMIFKKFKSLNVCIIYTVIFNMLIKLSRALLIGIGISPITKIYISIDEIILSSLGIILGYYINKILYKNKFNIIKNKLLFLE